MIDVYYQHREEGTELVEYHKHLKLHREACEILDDYPWEKELQLIEELGEGGGIFFIKKDGEQKHASYSLIPTAPNQCFLDIDIVCKPGWMKFFGRQAISLTLDNLSIDEAKQALKDVFDYSLEDLYQKYQK